MAMPLTDDHDPDLIIVAMGLLLGFFVISVRRRSLRNLPLKLCSPAHVITVAAYGVGLHIWDVYLANFTPGILQVQTNRLIHNLLSSMLT